MSAARNDDVDGVGAQPPVDLDGRAGQFRADRVAVAAERHKHRADHQPRRRRLGEILGDTTVAAAMLDRLLHLSVVLNLDGDSYRLRDHHARNDKFRATTTGNARQPLA